VLIVEVYYDNTYLTTIITDVLKNTSFPEYFIILNKEDKRYASNNRAFLKKFTKTINVREETLDDQELGCIIEDPRSLVKFDCTLSKKIRSLIQTMKMRLSASLFEGV
nr:hypothetical protein [Candidatus Sigynarchaeota archaeon]